MAYWLWGSPRSVRPQGLDTCCLECSSLVHHLTGAFLFCMPRHYFFLDQLYVFLLIPDLSPLFAFFITHYILWLSTCLHLHLPHSTLNSLSPGALYLSYSQMNLVPGKYWAVSTLQEIREWRNGKRHNLYCTLPAVVKTSVTPTWPSHWTTSCAHLTWLWSRDRGASWVHLFPVNLSVFTNMFDSPQYLQHPVQQTPHKSCWLNEYLSSEWNGMWKEREVVQRWRVPKRAYLGADI